MTDITAVGLAMQLLEEYGRDHQLPVSLEKRYPFFANYETYRASIGKQGFDTVANDQNPMVAAMRCLVLFKTNLEITKLKNEQPLR